MRIYKQAIIGLMLIAIITITSACGKKNNHAPKQKLKTVTAKLSSRTNVLYFKGIIKPIAMVNLISPAEGVVEKLYFHYGQKIKKGMPLLTIQSVKLQQDYQDALIAYLKAKDAYLNSKLKMQGTNQLYKAGLISKNEYESERSQNADSYLSYSQAKSKLNNILQKTKRYTDNIASVEKLSIEDTQAVEKAFAIKLNRLTLPSPSYGVVLKAEKSSTDNGEGAGGGVNKIKLGTIVKKNQVLLSIGDLSGLSMDLRVNEIDINQIKVGQKVKITSVAFPNIVLQGHVDSIDLQAGTSMTGGLPTFPVEIIVPHLNSPARKVIHIGMSAQVALMLSNKPAIHLPLSVVSEKNGRTLVKVLNKTTKKVRVVEVITGKTSLGSVVINKGIKEGDTIVLNH